MKVYILKKLVMVNVKDFEEAKSKAIEKIINLKNPEKGKLEQVADFDNIDELQGFLKGLRS